MTEQLIRCVDATTLPLEIFTKVHAQITDPPYSPHVHANITSAGTTGDGSRGWHRRQLAFKHLTPELRAFIANVAARVSGWSIVFSDFEGGHAWRVALGEAGAEYINRSTPLIETRSPAWSAVDEEDDDSNGHTFDRPWVRWSQPQKSGDRPTQGAELVLHAWGSAGGRKAWNGPGDLIAYEVAGLRQAKANPKHDCEKPLDLMLEMVSWYSNPGETVFDPCAGAGTTGLACRLLDREFWGCELDPEWAPRAAARLANVLSARDRERVSRYLEKTRSEARALLALPRTKHPKTGAYTDEKTRARAQRRLADADTVERIAA